MISLDEYLEYHESLFELRRGVVYPVPDDEEEEMEEGEWGG